MHQINNNLMQENIDKLTETRGSIELNPTDCWTNFKHFLCPCFVPKKQLDTTHKQKIDDLSRMTDTTPSDSAAPFNKNKNKFMFELGSQNNYRVSNNIQFRKTSEEIRDLSPMKRSLISSKNNDTEIKQYRETADLDFNKKFTSSQSSWLNNSIPSENQLFAIGVVGKKLIAKLSTVKLQLNTNALKKEIQNNSKKSKELKTEQLNEFWNQRYLFFSNFDEGMKIQEDSISSIPPEAVSDYIASKCCGGKLFIDAFSGIGATTLKLANLTSCIKVIACEQNVQSDLHRQKFKCLLNNAKICEVENHIELGEFSFLDMPQKRQADIVFINPRMGKYDLIDLKNVSLYDFDPSLDKLIYKTLKISNNMLMLLPPNISIETVCSCINKCCVELKKSKETCSIKIERIYFRNQFKYILLSFGTLVQTEIKINDQLSFIYKILKNDTEKNFKHKKIVKKIREDYGMIELLNLVKQSQKNAKDNSTTSIEEFYKLIREKKLVGVDKLQKIIANQQIENIQVQKTIENSPHSIKLRKSQLPESIKPIMEEEKVDDNQNITISERTQSYYSHLSFYTTNTKNAEENISSKKKTQSANSVFIKRTMNEGSKEKRRDISPKSPLNSPELKSKQQKNRASHIPVIKLEPNKLKKPNLFELQQNSLE